jgi:hypothetical protein
VSQSAEIIDGDGVEVGAVDARLRFREFDLACRYGAQNGRPFCCVADDYWRDFLLRRRFVLRYLFGGRRPIGVDLRGLGPFKLFWELMETPGWDQIQQPGPLGTQQRDGASDAAYLSLSGKAPPSHGPSGTGAWD